MIDLQDVSQIQQLDPKNVFGSTELFLQQCQQIWEDAKNITLDESLKNLDSILVCGMGGSAYGGYVLQTLFKDRLTVPLISNNDYDLPAFVNKKTLVVLSSYSGTTEESLTCGKAALEKHLPITGITNGGPLADFFKTNNLSALIFDPKHNPSTQPRLGTGYMVLGFIALLTRLGYLDITDAEVEQALQEFASNLDQTKTDAQTLAKELINFFPVIFSAEFLNGNAHILRNQFNETSKTFSAYEDIPELNHHLMEGLKNPENTPMKMLFLSSTLYSPIHNKRLTLTREVVEKNNIKTLTYEAKGSTKLSQMLNTLSFGGYITVYLGLLYGLDPSLIPWVDYFKEQLGK